MINRICGSCGIEFSISPSRHKKGKFCSLKCYREHKNKNCKINKKCIICGKVFMVYPSRLKIGEGKFCSTKCHGKWTSCNKSKNNHPNWKGGKPLNNCVICGREFHTSAYSLKHGMGKTCSRSCSAINNLKSNKRKDTSIEIKMEQELTRSGVIFQKQYPIWQARTIPDFFIAPNICIYCDGDYWHNMPKTKELNFNQNYWLEFYGYKVYRFWEHEINKSITKCVNTIKLSVE